MPEEADTATEILFWPKHNPAAGMDVNNDGLVTPLDALLIISNLTSKGSRSVISDAIGAPYFDASGDNVVSPLDVLKVIDHLSRNRGAGEGEPMNPLRFATPSIDRRPEDDYFATISDENSDFITINQDKDASIALRDWNEIQATRKVFSTWELHANLPVRLVGTT